MGSKLDQIIATIAIEVAGNHVDEMIAASKAAALEISSDDVANLPDRTSPKITSKAAGVPQFRDSWPNSWFTAILEILCQKGVVGLPALLTLLDRDGFSHQGEIVLRLLRMAAEDLERKAILDRLNAKLPSMHVTQVYDCVREVVFWSERDPLPL